MNLLEAAAQHTLRLTIYRMLPCATVADDGWGRYSTIQDAIDAGHKWIMVKAGDYPVSAAVLLDQDDVRIEGAGRSTRIRATGSTECFSITGDRNWIGHLSVENLPGGGGGGNNALHFSGAAVDNTVFGVWVRDSDDKGLSSNGPRNRFIACTVESADGDCVNFGTTGDNGLAVANHLKAGGGDAVEVTTNAENSLVVGNIGDDAFKQGNKVSADLLDGLLVVVLQVVVELQGELLTDSDDCGQRVVGPLGQLEVGDDRDVAVGLCIGTDTRVVLNDQQRIKQRRAPRHVGPPLDLNQRGEPVLAGG